MDIYCVDTSSFIEMKESYPKDIFPNLWENIEKLCKNGRLIDPDEVKKEIEKGDDDLKRWIKRKNINKIFIESDESQFKHVKKILKDHNFLAKPGKDGPNADPWLIALAIEKMNEQQENLFKDEYIVVTEESKVRNDRIPYVCKAYNIECINLIEFFRSEGWKF